VADGKEYNKQEVKDAADQASDSYENELLYGFSDTERKYIEEIENALKRVENGTYGQCNSCGKLINIVRLRSLPFARLCIKCQEDNEKSNGNNIARR
jgi:DnaK suppressor protein